MYNYKYVYIQIDKYIYIHMHIHLRDMDAHQNQSSYTSSLCNVELSKCSAPCRFGGSASVKACNYCDVAICNPVYSSIVIPQPALLYCYICFIFFGYFGDDM